LLNLLIVLLTIENSDSPIVAQAMHDIRNHRLKI